METSARVGPLPISSVRETAGRAAVPMTAAKTMETVTKASEEDIYLQVHANI